MIIYFDIDQPIIVDDAYFEVSFFSVPGNIQVGSTIIISDNLQHFIDLPVGDYRMNIVYYDGISYIEDEYNILVDENGDIIYGEDNEILYESVLRACSERDVYFTVPGSVEDPCDCGYTSAELVDNCDGSYHFSVSTSGGNNCGHTITYSRDTNTQPLQTINMVGESMNIPITGDIGHSYVRIDVLCCDGSSSTCLLADNLTPNSCEGCPMPLISFNNAAWVEIDNIQYIQISFNVEDGSLPIHVHARQLNQLTGPNNVPVIMHLEPITELQDFLIFNLQAHPLSLGTTDYHIRVGSDNVCIKDPNATGNIATTMFEFTMPPP